jgi:hypothetical protein
MSDPMREAAMHLSTEAAAAIDLYVLEQGPLVFDRDGDTFTVRQSVRLRLKEADEIRAQERERILAALPAPKYNGEWWYYFTDVQAAIAGGQQ